MVIMMLVLLFGCGVKVTQLQIRDTGINASEPSRGMKEVAFPKGTWTGGASREQASTLAQIFMNSHNMAMAEFPRLRDSHESIKAAQEALKGSTQRLEETSRQLKQTNLQILEITQQHQKTAQPTLQKIEDLSRKQGTGEMTLFYSAGVGKVKVNSAEYDRLVRFVDYLSRECKGRKILFVGLGSASAFGPQKVNIKLAKERAEFPQGVIDKYLVNTPHEYYTVYGTGDLYSPKGISQKEHERDQHTRVIALYELDQIPTLPDEQK
ncbi:MAG: hypothetical protein AB1558_13165 [Thermodesulfobacteriota bacterium]